MPWLPPPKCKERGDRDNSVFLTRPSNSGKEPRAKRTKCPKCQRIFTRLETHLRMSAVCRDLPVSSLVSSSMTSGGDSSQHLESVAFANSSMPSTGAYRVPPSSHVEHSHNAHSSCQKQLKSGQKPTNCWPRLLLL